MSWQSKVLVLVKKYGAPAKFAASTILNAVIPGSPAVIALVEQAFSTAEKTAQDDWELNLSKQVQTTAENQARLEQMLDILGGDLQHLFAQLTNFEKMPEIAQRLVEESQRSDARLHEAVKKLDGVAHRFDHLEDLAAQLLAGQHATHGKLDDLSAAVRKLMATPSAQILARARQMPVTAVVLTIRRCVVDTAQQALLLDAAVIVGGENDSAIPFRSVYYFINGQPLVSLLTDESGESCLRDPIRLDELKLQRKNILQVRVDDSAKGDSAEIEILKPVEVSIPDFDPCDDMDADGNEFSVMVRASFCGEILVQVKPEDFLDVCNVPCRCLLNGQVLGEGRADSAGRINIQFRREFKSIFSHREYSAGRIGTDTLQYPFAWSRSGQRKLKVDFPGLPAWYSVEMDLNR